MAKVCFVFLDGVGLGPATLANPWANVFTPTFHRLLGGPLIIGPAQRRPGLTFQPIDATLGVAGLPQSATGQTALFTGVNAPQAVGAHLAAFPTEALRAIIARHSLLKQATELGQRATFANAYTPRYWELVQARRLRHSATTWTNMAANLRFRDLDDLARGEAVYWDITHRILPYRDPAPIAEITPEEAGRRLADLTAAHDLVLYESFLPDLVGHRRLEMPPHDAVTLIDRFLGGLIEHLPADATLVLSSDHGNSEDTTTKAHTFNPVPLLALGPDAEAFAQVRDITGITPAILALLGAEPERP